MQFAAIHPESRVLLGSWKALNGIGGSEIAENLNSHDATGLIDRLFLAQRINEGVFTFTTIGKELKIWSGRDLREHEIGSLFYGADKVLIRALLEATINAPGPSLARVAAFGAGISQRADIEMVFLPLIEKKGNPRILGLFQPLAANVNISRPALRFAITALLPPDPSVPINPGLRLVKK